MPHMMPMLWLSMMLFTLMIMFLIISSIYFMYLPIYNNNNILLIYDNMSYKFKWIWKW
uniref:ATP synthase F0 subunit 8 n=1 Tax=Nylanderia flavipes TaxID=67766 RepID=A0A6B9BKZ5_9HYME|nr:ATP synthase F0 subunit 8 [Nylanderia flavipes]QGW36362.1 ATP synthase F0 subunit 8 [Nylanderia flavipes]